MESVDLRVLRTARDWSAAGERLLLVTVVTTWGSSPRPVGSMMVLREDGRCAGSVSGGCIEDDLMARYTRAHGATGIPETAPQVVRYGVSADEAHRFGLPCGGTLELLLEFNPDFARWTGQGCYRALQPGNACAGALKRKASRMREKAAVGCRRLG